MIICITIQNVTYQAPIIGNLLLTTKHATTHRLRAAVILSFYILHIYGHNIISKLFYYRVQTIHTILIKLAMFSLLSSILTQMPC
jgi:hypothetical protein